jgi:hypothetical protein
MSHRTVLIAGDFAERIAEVRLQIAEVKPSASITNGSGCCYLCNLQSHLCNDSNALPLR